MYAKAKQARSAATQMGGVNGVINSGHIQSARRKWTDSTGSGGFCRGFATASEMQAGAVKVGLEVARCAEIRLEQQRASNQMERRRSQCNHIGWQE